MKEQKSKAGGARQGAGRKRMGAERREQLGCTVTPETLSYLKDLAASEGTSMGVVIEAIVKAHRASEISIDDDSRAEKAIGLLESML